MASEWRSDSSLERCRRGEWGDTDRWAVLLLQKTRDGDTLGQGVGNGLASGPQQKKGEAPSWGFHCLDEVHRDTVEIGIEPSE